MNKHIYIVIFIGGVLVKNLGFPSPLFFKTNILLNQNMARRSDSLV